LTIEDSDVFVRFVAKEITEDKSANEKVFLRRTIAQGFELDKEEKKTCCSIKFLTS
jgi:hypothetical protein